MRFAGLQGNHRHPGVVSRALRRRPRQSPRAGPAGDRKDGIWRAVRRSPARPILARSTATCSTPSAASRSQRPSWRATSGCCSTRANCSSRSSTSRSAPAPWRTSGIRCAPNGSAALARFVISLQANTAHTAASQWLERTPGRQRQPAADTPGGFSRHRCHPGPGHQYRGGPRGARRRHPPTCE